MGRPALLMARQSAVAAGGSLGLPSLLVTKLTYVHISLTIPSKGP